MYRVRLIRLNVCFLLTRVSSYSLMRRDFCWLFVCFSNFSRHASKQTGRAPSSCLVGDFSLTMTYHFISKTLCQKTVHWIHQGEDETHQKMQSKETTTTTTQKKEREKDPDRPSRCVTHRATTHTQQMNTPFSLLDLLQSMLFLHY